MKGTSLSPRCVMKERMEEACINQQFDFEVAAVVDPFVHFPRHLFGRELIENVHIVAVSQVSDFEVEESFEEAQVFVLMVLEVIRR